MGWPRGPSAAVDVLCRCLRWRRGRAGAAGLLPRWVVASAVTALVGLGGTGVIVFTFYRYAGEPAGVAAVLLAFVVAVGSGAVEAAVVRLAQHWAMGPWPRALCARQARSWPRAPVVGVINGSFLVRLVAPRLRA